MDDDSRQKLAILKEDIFVHWIAQKVLDEQGRVKVVFVAMWMPQLARMRKQSIKNAERTDAFMKEFRTDKSDPAERQEKAQEFLKTVDKPVLAPWKDYDFAVANFDFVETNGHWLIDNIAMSPGKLLMNPWFHFRWKGRVAMTLSFSTSFIRVLQYDYFTDLFLLAMALAIVISRFL